MINKKNAGLKAVHQLIIEARTLSRQGENGLTTELLDRIEYLPALMLEDSNQSEFFDEYLEDICKKFRLELIHEKFKASSK